MRIVRRRVIAALSIGLTLALLPTAANACDDDLTLVYVYRKITTAAPASWDNSGPQTLILVRGGHRWTRHLDASLLPDDVCGPGWAVQEDQTRGLPRAQVPTVVDRATGTGVLSWPPVVAARHRDLEHYLDVPDCDAPPPVDEETPPPTETPTPPVTPTPTQTQTPPVTPTPTPTQTQITVEEEQQQPPEVQRPPVQPQVKPAVPAVAVQAAPVFAG